MKKFIGIFLLFYVVQGYGQCTDSFSLGNDTAICQGTTVLLEGDNGYDTYQWQDNSANQGFMVSSSGTYYCKVTKEDENNNLIQNGDFEQGNTLFTTNYAFYAVADIFGPNASYGIVSNPNTWFNPFSPCPDHTSGTGNMMVADGSSVNGGNDALWCQNVVVSPNTNYNFGYWVQSVTGAPYADLRIEINGNVLGADIAPTSLCVWEEHAYMWSSGANANAQICIYDNELGGNGNDFAIDDIYLHTICEYEDSIEVIVIPSDTIQEEEILCSGEQIFLAGDWQSQAGIYYDTFFNMGCLQYIETMLSFLPNPTANIEGDINLSIGDETLLSATNTIPVTQYTWLSNGVEIGNEESITIQPDVSTQYILSASRNGCENQDTVTVTVKGVDLILPTAFSPNGDDLNDVFRIINTEKFAEIELSIYNRWGELIHKGSDDNHPWDGIYKGNSQPIGNYVYFITAKPLLQNSNISFTGSFMLLH